MTDYPVPGYAAQIWIAGDELKLALPSPLDAPSHTVTLPNNERGLALALQILREREHDFGTIGRASAPTQYMTERQLANDAKYNAMLRAMREGSAERQKEKAEAAAFLEEIGLGDLT